MADGGGLACPPCSQFARRRVRSLAGSGVAGGLAFHGGELAGRLGSRPLRLDELRDAVVHLDGDVVRCAWRTGRSSSLGTPGDLGLAVDDGIERDAVAGGQLGAQGPIGEK